MWYSIAQADGALVRGSRLPGAPCIAFFGLAAATMFYGNHNGQGRDWKLTPLVLPDVRTRQRPPDAVGWVTVPALPGVVSLTHLTTDELLAEIRRRKK